MPATRGRAVYVLVADGRNHGRATAMREGSVEAAHDSCYRRGRGCGRGGRRRRDPAPSASTSLLIGADSAPSSVVPIRHCVCVSFRRNRHTVVAWKTLLCVLGLVVVGGC